MAQTSKCVCCDCHQSADVYLVYANSLLGVCKKCLIVRFIKFDYFENEYHYPIIVPAKFIDIPQSKNWFPEIIIKFGDEETMYGKPIAEFKEWQYKALASVEFNIP